MAGAEGFEPTNAGNKTRGLNHWATRLGVFLHSADRRKRVQQRRARRALHHPGAQPGRQERKRSLGGGPVGELHEAAAAGTGQARRTDVRKGLEDRLDGRLPATHDRLERVAEQ